MRSAGCIAAVAVSLLLPGAAAADTLLIADKDADVMLVFDTASGRVTRTIPVGGNPS